MRRYWPYIVAGLLIGLFAQHRVETAAGSLLFARDSASGASVVIQTNGTNALKVLPK